MMLAPIIIFGELVLLLETLRIVLDAATWKISTLHDSDVAEAHDFRLALQFALDLGFRNTMMEGDSLTVVRALNNYVAGYSYIGLLIDDCGNIRSSFLIV